MARVAEPAYLRPLRKGSTPVGPFLLLDWLRLGRSSLPLYRRNRRHLAHGVRWYLRCCRGCSYWRAGGVVAGCGGLGLGRVDGHLFDRCCIRRSSQPGGQPRLRDLPAQGLSGAMAPALLGLADAGSGAGRAHRAAVVRLPSFEGSRCRTGWSAVNQEASCRP